MANDHSTARDTVHAFLKAMEKMDFDTATKHIAEHCEYTNPPPFGTVHGPAGVRTVLGPFFAPILENEFIIKREAVNGNIVFIERLDRHRLAGGWVELPINAVLEVQDGKITVWHEYFDTATIQNGIAALPS